MDTPTEASVLSQEIKISRCKDESGSTVHMLPCKVVCKGEEGVCSASVSDFFTTTLRPSQETVPLSRSREPHQVYTATFRGRGLKGVRLCVPDQCTGVVLTEINHSSQSDEQEREFVSRSKFSEFTYWSVETPPTPDDRLLQALTWTTLSHSLHTPVPVKEDVIQ